MSKAGLKCIEDVFPSIPEVATEFFKKNGFKVQQKQQNNDFISCGVTVTQVKEHFLKVMTGLVECSISDNTVKFVFRFDIINFMIF